MVYFITCTVLSCDVIYILMCADSIAGVIGGVVGGGSVIALIAVAVILILVVFCYSRRTGRPG